MENIFRYTLCSYRRNKGFFLVSVCGLAVGLASCLLILLWVQHETGFDVYHDKADRLFRVTTSFRMGDQEKEIAVTSAPLARILLDEFPEVQQATRLYNPGNLPVEIDEQMFGETVILFADPSFFQVFSIPVRSGSPASAFQSPNSVMVSRRAALTFFGIDDPTGRTLRLQLEEPTEATVAGVYEDIAPNTHFQADMLVSLATIPSSRSSSWSQSENFHTYVVFRPGVQGREVEDKFPSLMRTHLGPEFQRLSGMTLDEFNRQGNYLRLGLQKVTDIHLHSHLGGELRPNGDALQVAMFAGIAIFILLIAGINFVNLANAYSIRRAREIGIRKILGSPRAQLIRHFLMEFVVQSLLALGIALVLVEATLPLFNLLTRSSFSFPDLAGRYTMAAILLTPLLGILAGSYPALIMSRFDVLWALRGGRGGRKTAGRLQTGLVIFQFAMSIMLLVGTLVIHRQMQYIQSRGLGFEKEHVLLVHHVDRLAEQAATFKSELLAHERFSNASLTSYLPGSSRRSSTSTFPPGEFQSDRTVSMQHWAVDDDYCAILGLHIIQGRDFDPARPADQSAVIINEATARHFGWADAIGRQLSRPDFDNPQNILTFTVIGVVRDFHFESLHSSIEPVALYRGDTAEYLVVHLTEEDLPASLAALREIWQRFAPRQPLNYSFLDEHVAGLYTAERQMRQVMGVFTTLALFIAALGLFSLTTAVVEQRTKEMGIRKILGATIPELLALLSRAFLGPVLVAFIIAAPTAWWLMADWLDGFAYRAELDPWIVLLAGWIALVTAMMTISGRTLRVARVQPVDVLRQE